MPPLGRGPWRPSFSGRLRYRLEFRALTLGSQRVNPGSNPASRSDRRRRRTGFVAAMAAALPSRRSDQAIGRMDLPSFYKLLGDSGFRSRSRTAARNREWRSRIGCANWARARCADPDFDRSGISKPPRVLDPKIESTCRPTSCKRKSRTLATCCLDVSSWKGPAVVGNQLRRPQSREIAVLTVQ